jgi:hypothetical protein
LFEVCAVNCESLLPGPAVGKAMRLVARRHGGLACLVKELLPAGEGSSGQCVW